MQVRFAAKSTTVSFADWVAEGRGIWYNPGTFERLECESIRDDTEFQFVSRQHAAALTFLEEWITPNCLDAPALQRKWSNKPAQLRQLAAHVGNYLPETVLTSDVSMLGSDMVIKHAGENRWMSESTAFFAQTATPELLNSLRQGTMAPILGQQRLRARHEYRTFRFGHRGVTVCFPKDDSSVMVDLQYHPDRVKRAVLSDPVIEASFWEELNHAFQLNIYAVDFVLLDGGPVIMEINPAFGWAWLPPSCVEGVTSVVRDFLDDVSV